MAKQQSWSWKDRQTTYLLIICGALLIALICVSAFAYQWHGENVDLKKKNQTLKALTDDSTIDSLMNELSTAQQNLLAAQSMNEEYARKIASYEGILGENGLLPTAAPATGN